MRSCLVVRHMAGTQWIRDDGTGGGHGRHTSRGGPALRGSDAPVYAALAAQWRSAGRMVPGQADTEWTALITRAPHRTPV